MDSIALSVIRTEGPETLRAATAFPFWSKMGAATHNNWGAMLFDGAADSAQFAPSKNGQYVPFEIRDFVDRVGGGDSFSAGVVYALMDAELDASGRVKR